MVAFMPKMMQLSGTVLDEWLTSLTVTAHDAISTSADKGSDGVTIATATKRCM